MPEVVEHLAELTAHRDRDLLDATLVAAFRDLLRPRAVAVWRCVGEVDDPRWLSRARIGTHETVPGVDPMWSDIDSLPRLADHPERAVVLAEARTLSVPPAARGEPHRCLFPIASDQEVLGVLEVETDQALPESGQRLVANMLRIIRNFQALLDYSERDNLTGLLNRKTFDESFLKLIARPAIEPDGRRAGAAGHWLAVIDIDHFKRVNDNFGHLIGDEVLLLLSRLMRSCFRADDRLYRFGGEEFVVLMRCHGEASAALALERLRAAVERYNFPQAGRITVSVGFTGVQPGDAPSAAFDRADKAVYHAKGHGRNQVCSHAELVSRGVLADESKVGDVELF